MPNKLVTIARFAVEAEAQLACNLLESHGVRCLLTGSIASTALYGPVLDAGGVHLQVLEDESTRAIAILAENERAAGGLAVTEADAERAVEAWTWTCPRCDSEVPGTEVVCPRCGASIEGEPEEVERVAQGITTKEMLPQVLGQITDTPPRTTPEEVPLPTAPGDELANRAFRAALAGAAALPFLVFFVCNFPDLITIYSWSLLFLIMVRQLDLSPAAQRKMNLAVLIDSLVVLAQGTLYAAGLVAWRRILRYW